MKYFVLLLAACFSLKVSAQFFSTKLLQKLDGNASSNKFDVNIYIKNDHELSALKHAMRNEQVPVSERPARVNSLLKMQAEDSQQALIDFANQIAFQPTDFSVRARYHIVNMISAEASAAVLWALTQRSEVEWICLRDEIQLKYDVPVAMERGTGRSVGGHEPGHDAINAPFMWNLGYTGLGRRLYTVDTGIWTVHPAVARQYRGNYLPEAHCWLGFDFQHPADKPDAHGTHVTGTVLGLDPATSDTIGLAFNATYIATDPIVEDIGDVRPLEDILAAFEFALDPDDNPNTNDVPDIICNSWGFGDTIVDGLCSNPIVVGLFEALDAAGIAVEFSAGNEGPGTATMGMPAYVVLDSVNVFSVGAVNGNLPGFPIADFSSRGPSSCGDGGQLAIKPEVSAPGVNVRSSVQQDEYALYQGTSMAGPHVAGAVLLLKEAFPMLEGRDILYALYSSASDLGEPGEDNVYGKGIINLEAAYTYLSLNHTPEQPNTSPYDLAIVEILAPTFTCPGNYTFGIVLQNTGSEGFSGAGIRVGILGGTEDVIEYTGTMAAGARDTVYSNPIALSAGWLEIKAEASLLIDVVEYETLNNSRIHRVNVRPEVSLPFAETFEYNDLSGNNLFVTNGDYKITWDTIHTRGLNNSSYSGYYKLLNNALRDTADYLYLPFIGVPASSDSLMFSFNYAYRFRSNTLSDSLNVQISDDCGQSWNSIFYKGGSELASFDTTWVNFKPFAPQHWKKVKIDLLPLLSGESIIIRYKPINDLGSNLFIDNVFVYSNENPETTHNPTDISINIFPNPADDLLQVKLERFSDAGGVTFSVVDATGRIVFDSHAETEIFQLNTSNFKPGIYNLIARFKGRIGIQRFVVVR